MSVTSQENCVSGCIGRITQMHATYYSNADDVGLEFEANVAREWADFCTNYRPGRNGIWLTLRDGSIEGSVVIDGSKANTGRVHLRWFITSVAAKGIGIGIRLLQEAMRFVDACDYPTTYI